MDLDMLVEWVVNYRDRYSMLSNKDRDGGDCAHNFPMYYIALDYLGHLTEFKTASAKEFARDLAMVSCLNEQLDLKQGQYVRHPDVDKWYSRLEHMSRDQTKSLLTGMAYFGHVDKIEQLFNELKSRNFLHWNTKESDEPFETKIADPVSLSQLRLFISSSPKLKNLKFILPILDLDFLYTSLHGYKKWDASIKQFTELLTIEKQGSHTFVSRLAAKIFKAKQEVPTLIEEAYTVHALAIPPLGYIMREAFSKWSKN